MDSATEFNLNKQMEMCQKDVHAVLVQLVDQGHEPQVVLSVMLGQVAVEVAGMFGCEFATDQLRAAADRVQSFAVMNAPLENTPAMGRC